MRFLVRSYIGKYEGRQRMLFERYAHSVLSHGGTFECRRLTQSDEVHTIASVALLVQCHM